MLAMGWEGYHLKEIRHGNYTYFVRLAGGQDPEPVEGFPQRDSFKYTLGDLLKEEWDSFIFVYDLGDAWKHRVTLTGIAPGKEEDAKEDAVAAYLVSGENACPPEDVGGVDGYAEALQSFSNPEDDEYESIRQWIGEDFLTSLTFAALAGEWMISSELLVKPGGGSIINESSLDVTTAQPGYSFVHLAFLTRITH